MKRILIVDDNAADLTQMKEFLKDKYEVETAISSKDAAELITQAFDVYLLDIILEKTAGNYIAQKIRDGFGIIPKIIYVSLKPKSDLTETDLKISNGFIQKPFSKEQLIAEIENQL